MTASNSATNPTRPTEESVLLLGKIAIANHLASEEQVADCLEVQRKMLEWGIKSSIGEILVDKDVLNEDQVRDLLEIQRRMRPDMTEDDWLSQRTRVACQDSVLFGELLRLNGILSKQQVEETIEIQRELQEMGVDKRLGDLLIKKSMLRQETVEALLRIQENWLGHGFKAQGYRYPELWGPMAAAIGGALVVLSAILWIPDRRQVDPIGTQNHESVDASRKETQRQDTLPRGSASSRPEGLPPIGSPGSMNKQGQGKRGTGSQGGTGNDALQQAVTTRRTGALDPTQKYRLRKIERAGPDQARRGEALRRLQGPKELARLRQLRIDLFDPQAYTRFFDAKNQTPEQLERRRKLAETQRETSRIKPGK